jgi:hypothetical protein
VACILYVVVVLMSSSCPSADALMPIPGPALCATYFLLRTHGGKIAAKLFDPDLEQLATATVHIRGAQKFVQYIFIPLQSKPVYLTTIL